MSALLAAGAWPPPGLGREDPWAGELAVAARAALEGGRAAMQLYGSRRLGTEEKSPGDPVSEADHAANHAILSLLTAVCPEDPILSEESIPPEGATAAGRLWVVDPLDGTKEFITEIGEFAVMVGLAVDGRAVAGAVFLPDPDVLYVGLSAGGAWRAESASRMEEEGRPALRFAPLKVPPRGGPTLRLIRSRSHPDPLLQAVEQALHPAEIVPSGSVGVKCVRIALGEADLYVHPVPYLKEWDTCAPEAVLRGAGGRVTDCAGGDLEYGKADPHQLRGILAGSPEAWSRTAPLVRAVVEPLLSAAE